MNATQIHLALNHVPLFFSVLGGLILFYGTLQKNSSIQRLSFFILAAGALFAIPVYLTGEGTEDMVEKLPGVSENMISEHEEMAGIALGIIIAAGVVSLIGIAVQKSESYRKFAVTAALLLSLASFGAMAQTAHLGGQIRHSEIRGAAAAGTEGKESKENEEENKAVAPAENTVTDSTTKEKVKEKDDDD